MNPVPPVLWRPSEKFIADSNLQKYLGWLKKTRNLEFAAYPDLWKWSVENIEDFWQSVWDYFEIMSDAPPEKVLSSPKMPGARWFENTRLNYAEHIFRNRTDRHPALIFQSENVGMLEISWEELHGQVASMQSYLKEIGIKKGDRVAAYLPNIPEATVAFLAACSLGAVWSSCSPDFGVNSIVDRFEQIEPKVLFAADGYTYNGKPFSRKAEVQQLVEKLPTLEKVIMVNFLNPEENNRDIPKSINWLETFRPTQKIHFERVAFNDPIWVLYSSGTTGAPKAITHSQGGVLLEHLKYLTFHNDVKPGERFFWFSTTGWMMWNFLNASLLVGATAVLYEGSPGYPYLNTLWKFAEKAKITHFGTSAPFLIANMKADFHPGRNYDFSALRSIGSTGSPLPPEAFDWVYREVKKDVWLCSMAGGTDVCTAWVGGCPVLPLYEGEIQCRCLGADLRSFDENGEEIIGEVGEMVVLKPMPSMPVFFWNDKNDERYLSSYFEMYPGIWRHGDWVNVTERDSVIILGRSDATLNRQGVRIGTAEIYRAVDKVSEIQDSLIVNIELEGGKDFMPLFVVLKKGESLTADLKQKINQTLRREFSPRHVPDEIFEIHEIPLTISGKKMETPVKKILMGVAPEKAAAQGTMKNPEALKFFIDFQKNKFS